MAVRKKKGKLTTAVILIVVAVGALVAYLWSKNKKAAASQSAATSSGVASVAYPSQAGTVQSPNSFGSAPVIQNFTSASSTAVSPVTVVHAFSKPRPPMGHPPTSPMRTPGPQASAGGALQPSSINYVNAAGQRITAGFGQQVPSGYKFSGTNP